MPGWSSAASELWERTPHGALPGTIAEVLAQEKAALMPTPPAFDGFVEQSKRVSPTCLINFERNRYSVPASFANRPVSLRIYPDRLVVAAEGQIVCEHAAGDPALAQAAAPDDLRLAPLSGRHPAKARGAPQWRALRRTARSLPARSSSICSSTRAATGRWWRSSPWCCSTTKQAVLCAVELALEAGVPTKTHVLNLLHRLIDDKPRRHARGRPAEASGADRGAQGRMSNAMTDCAARHAGGAPCVMIPPAPPSSSCCAA